MTTVILFGATGKTGLALSKLIIKNDMELFAAVRTERDRKHLESLGANTFIADALHPHQVLESMNNVNERNIVISLVGGSSKGTGVRADYLGNKNIIEAAVTSGLKRFIFVTAIGSGESRHELPDIVKPFLGPIAAEKTKAENEVTQKFEVVPKVMSNWEPFLSEDDNSLTFQVQILGQFVLVEES
jgi:nucleoside-diphosphate-sugar epimerase